MNTRSLIITACLTAVLAASVAIAAGAIGSSSAPDHRAHDASPQGRLDSARRSWSAAGLRSYRYDIEASCFCPPQKRTLVLVRNGHPTRFPVRMSGVATVPRMFAAIQRAIDERVKLAVSYGAHGVPRSIAIDLDLARDAGVGYDISHFAAR